MKKILIPLLLLLSLTFTSFSQQGKFQIGSFTLYDSSGTLVISGGDFKVNYDGWIKPKDLNSTVGGVGLTVHPTLGIRFNAGTGLEVGSNDSVVSTQELSFAEVDSISISGLVLKVENQKLSTDRPMVSDSTLTVGRLIVNSTASTFLSDAIVNLQFTAPSFVGSLQANGVSIIDFEGNPVTKIKLNNFTHIYDSLYTGLRVHSQAGFLSNGDITFENGATANIGTVDAFGLAFKTNNTARLTISTTTVTSTLPIIIDGTTSYFLLPRLTTVQRDALTPVAGMMIHNITDNKTQVYSTISWVDLY